jgi:hypothetical protein
MTPDEIRGEYKRTTPISPRGRIGNCEVCGIWYPALEEDHKIPKHLGGTDDKENIQIICPNCHGIKTAIERQVQFRKRIGKNNPMFGKHKSKQWRKEQSERVTGAKHPMFGRKHSEESKQRMRDKVKAAWANGAYENRVPKGTTIMADESLKITNR